MSLRLWDPSSIIISNFLKLHSLVILLIILTAFFWLLISSPKTWIFFDLYSKFEILISKQKIFESGKYFANAAAEAPA